MRVLSCVAAVWIHTIPAVQLKPAVQSVVLMQYGFTPYLLYNSSQLSSLLGATPPSSATSRRMRSLLQSSSSTNPYTNSKVPQRIDFRSLQIGTKTYNYMSAVKNQEQCGTTTQCNIDVVFHRSILASAYCSQSCYSVIAAVA